MSNPVVSVPLGDFSPSDVPTTTLSPPASPSSRAMQQNLLQELESNAVPTFTTDNVSGSSKSAKQSLPPWATSLLISLGLSILLTGILWAVFYGISQSKTKKNVQRFVDSQNFPQPNLDQNLRVNESN